MLTESNTTTELIPAEIIRKKRSGDELATHELEFMVNGLLDGTINPEQIIALAMATYFQGMTAGETASLTGIMAKSGTILAWDKEQPVVDKHSTGGVGDKVSFVLAPVLAACDCLVPMISGRGLGFTGGTLDKIDSIPGYTSQPDLATMRKVVNGVGCAIIGQTAELAPADRKIYALRDVCGCVEIPSLITASILSKKLAAGLQHLVLDIKFGNGAFCSTLDEARTLATSLQGAAQANGLQLRYLLTDMNQPLGRSVGNALEINEIADWLIDPQSADSRLAEVTLALGDQLLLACGRAESLQQARKLQHTALTSGKAAEKFAAMVTALGGPGNFLEQKQQILPQSEKIVDVCVEQDGFISEIATREIGLFLIQLGGGRKRQDDKIDHMVGIDKLLPLGTKVSRGDRVARLHLRQAMDAEQLAAKLLQLFTINDESFTATPLILTN